tara:strand:- start:38 stop:283 length:246 start_codon:yes stop_codon:yes gene_type:complete
MTSTKYKKQFQKIELKNWGVFHPRWDEPLEVYPSREEAAEAMIDAFEHECNPLKELINGHCEECLTTAMFEPEVCVILPVA